METLGPLIRKTRAGKGIRAADLAYQMGKDPSYLSKLERGLLKEIPEPEVLAALENALGIPQERMLRALGYAIARPSHEPAAMEPGYEAVLAIADAMDERQRFGLAATGKLILDLMNPETAANREIERLPALR